MAPYTAKQFSGCVFNPLTNGSIIAAYPELAAIEWQADPNFDGIFRWVVCVYDPKSPLILKERDLNKRKEAACELLGITGDVADQVINCTYPAGDEKTPWVGDLVFLYLKEFVRSREWITIQALEFSFYESIKMLMQPIADGKDRDVLEAVQRKGIIKGGIEADLNRLDGYYTKFFGGDEKVEGVVKSKRYTPENMLR